MIKRIIQLLFITILYFVFTNTSINAKEYCHFYVNDEYKDTIELPFYFYENMKTTTLEASWPQTYYSISYKKIESITQCESIKKTLPEYDPYNMIGTFTKYDYTNKLYTQYSDQEIYSNSKLAKMNTTIKGYSTIIDEEPPVISEYKDLYNTNIDNPIDITYILRNISAYDERDGNITSNIVIEYNEYEANLIKLGTYPVIISVTDNSNNKTSATFYIEIKDLTPPTIEGKQNYISPISSPLNIEEIKSNLIVKDNVDINLESLLYVCEDNYSPNKNKIGLYSVYFCVMDYSYNESSPYKIVIEVKDDIPPTISGTTYFSTGLSNLITIDEILYSLRAIDNEIDISNSIFIINDNYSTSKNIIGEKTITFQVKDESQNLSSPFTVKIDVIDDIAPQIYGLNTFTSYLSSPLSLTYLKQQLTVLDNYEGDISSSLEIVDDTYSFNINNKGTYHISFKVKDSSDNYSETFKINITNIDNVPPSITGPSSLKYTLENKPTIQQILSEFNVFDNVDSNLEITIEEDTYSDSQTTGTYYVSLSCTDLEENKSPVFTIKIEVVDILLDLNELSLSLPTSKNYTIEEINEIINLEEPYTIVQNTYSPNYNIKGNYIIEYKLENSSTIIININTYTDQKQQTQITSDKQKKETLFSKIKSFFSTIFTKIKNFLTKIFNLHIHSIFFQ